MHATAKQVGLPIGLGREEGEAIWSFGALATIKASGEGTNGRFALFELLAPQGAGSPLHIHHNEDEWFYVTEGELTFWVNGKVIQGRTGSFVYGPRDLPHTFEVRRWPSLLRAGPRGRPVENSWSDDNAVC